MFRLGAGCPWHGVRAGPGVPLSVPQGTGGTQHREWPRPEHHRAEAEPPCYRPALEYCSDGETLTASAFKPRSLRRAAGRAGRQRGGSGLGGPPLTRAAAGRSLWVTPLPAGAENGL